MIGGLRTRRDSDRRTCGAKLSTRSGGRPGSGRRPAPRPAQTILHLQSGIDRAGPLERGEHGEEVVRRGDVVQPQHVRPRAHTVGERPERAAQALMQTMCFAAEYCIFSRAMASAIICRPTVRLSASPYSSKFCVSVASM